VTIGQLPDDFLRLDAGTSNGVAAAPMTDEQLARQLQQEINASFGPPQVVGMPGFVHNPYYNVGSFVPVNTRGRLSVTIVEARLNKNYGLVRMDPYCRLRVGHTVFETPTDVNGSKAPKWNRTVHCYLPVGVDGVFVEIFDERAFTTDERIAWAHVKIADQVFANETTDDWYALSGQLGDGQEGMVNLQMSFAPVDTMAQQQQQPQAIVIGAPIGAAVTIQQNVPVATVADHADATPRFTEKDVDELHEVFPNVAKDVITSVLIEKSGNKDAAVNALLAISAE